MTIKKRYLVGASFVAAAIGWTFLPFWVQATTAVLAGVVMAPVAMLIAAPLFFKEQFKHDPARKSDSERPEKIGMFIEVQQGRSAVIVKGGKPLYVIEGGKHEPEEDEAVLYVWYLFQKYCFNLTGYHAYIPYFHKPHVYGVPHYALNRHNIPGYQLIGEGDAGYWSNHVRTEPTTWHFVFTGVDIQKVQFTIKGSALIRIVPGMEIPALFDIDSWSELLNQALESTIRNYMRAMVSLDEILGRVSQNLWDESSEATHMDKIAKEIKDNLRDYKVTNRSLKEVPPEGGKPSFDASSTKKLIEFGIDIQRLDLRDFDCESAEERAKFAAAAIGREEGRRKSLEGQGIAEAEEKLLAVHDGGEASLAIIKNRGFVDAVKGSNVVETVLGALARKNMGDN